MRKVLLYSILLIAGLVISQFLGDAGAYPIKVATMLTLAFIMIHVGYEFEIDKQRPGQYAWDYVVAATAATFPWVLCAAYFVLVMAPPELWGHADLWRETLLASRFASPTSAGVLFSMLAAAGLAATWVFKKTRILAIFDDLDTILLMIPLTFLIVGFRWQLLALVAVMLLLLWLAWRYLHMLRLPLSWPYIMSYAALIALTSEAVYLGSKTIGDAIPVHLEVLLPAFVIGCLLARPHGYDPHAHDSVNGHEQGPENRQEQRAATVVSAAFMVLVGLSMPPIQSHSETRPAVAEGAHAVAAAKGGETDNASEKKSHLSYAGASPEIVVQKDAFPGWGIISGHVLVITALSNLGKMFPVLCYRREANLYERLAVAISMFPRGEVGAGVLVISLSYGLKGPVLTVAALSLALNLLCSGLFIVIVKTLLGQARAHPISSKDRNGEASAGGDGDRPAICSQKHASRIFSQADLC